MISVRTFRTKLSLSKLKSPKLFYSTSNVATVGAEDEKIIIPKRIERGPTDILKALSSTVKIDYTAPNYKYHDDPYFYPYSTNLKRSFALAKESGRKSARYFLDNYPELFYRDDAEPKVPAFSFKEIYDENDLLTAEDLINCIKSRNVAEAIKVYKSMNSKNVDLPVNVKQSLLELVCFYNSSEEDFSEKDEYLEEIWFRNPKTVDVKRSWIDEGFAEELFNSFDEKDAKSYCALMSGLGKYYRSEKLFKYFDEMKEKNLTFNVKIFNTLIENVPFIRESSETRWELIIQLLDTMNKNEIKPNVNTFNAVLEVLTRSAKWRNCKTNALLVFNEMKRLNIKPSLATYNFLLQIFYKDRSQSHPLLYEILREIKEKSFTIKHPKDVFFFRTAMDVCNYNLGDIHAAYEVHSLFQIGENQKFIGDGYKESIYYNNFFRLHCMSETADKLMEVYNNYVPNVYIPESSLMFEIINSLELYDAHHYLPQIWSDIILFDMLNRENVVDNILRVMGKSKMDNEDLQKQFGVIAGDAVRRNEQVDEKMRKRRFKLSGFSLINCLKIFINCEEISKALHVIQYINDNESDIVGLPTSKELNNLVKLICEKGTENQLIKCINYAGKIGCLEVHDYLRENREKFSLSDKIIEELNQYQQTQ